MLLYIWFKLVQFFVFILPRRLSYGVGRLIGRLYYLFPSEARGAVRRNIARILDYTRGEDASPARRVLVNRLVKEMFENFGVHIIDFFDIANFNRRGGHERLEKVGMENLDRVLEGGRGVIIVTAHIGNWELGPRVMTDMGYKFGAVEIRHENKRLDKFFTELRVNSGALMAHEGFEIRHMMKVLKQNGLATFVIDRDVNRTGRKVMLFGEETTLVRGAPEFCCRIGIPIVPAFMFQKADGKHELVFYDPIVADGSMDKEEQVEALYAEVTRVLESTIARHPSQWFIFYDIWPQLREKESLGK